MTSHYLLRGGTGPVDLIGEDTSPAIPDWPNDQSLREASTASLVGRQQPAGDHDSSLARQTLLLGLFSGFWAAWLIHLCPSVAPLLPRFAPRSFHPHPGWGSGHSNGWFLPGNALALFSMSGELG